MQPVIAHLLIALAFVPSRAGAQVVPPAPTPAAATPTRTVAVLDHAVAKGDLLTAGDFTTREEPVIEARAAPRLKDMVGMEAARALSAGAIIRPSDLIRPQLVRRGEPVVIALRDGGLSITTAGRALGSGAAGDFVRIVSLSTNRTLDGVVESTGTVRVTAH